MANNLTHGYRIYTNHLHSLYLSPAMLSLEAQEQPSNATTPSSIMNTMPADRKHLNLSVRRPLKDPCSNGECEYEPPVFREGYEFNSTAEERARIIVEERRRSPSSCNPYMNPRPRFQSEFKSAAVPSSSHPLNQNYLQQVHEKRQPRKGNLYYQQPYSDMGNYPDASPLSFHAINAKQFYGRVPFSDTRHASGRRNSVSPSSRTNDLFLQSPPFEEYAYPPQGGLISGQSRQDGSQSPSRLRSSAEMRVNNPNRKLEPCSQLQRRISGNLPLDSSLRIPFFRSDGTIEAMPQYAETLFCPNAIPDSLPPSIRRYPQNATRFDYSHPVSFSSTPYPRDVPFFMPVSDVSSSDNGTQGSVSGSEDSCSKTKPSPHPRKHMFPRGQLPPGEYNPDAVLGAKLCFEFMNKGVCERQRNGGVCHFRHLSPNHPDAIADRFRSGLLSDDEIAYYKLRPCGPFETNPFAPRDAKICFEFLNKHVCSRNMRMQVCHFRHLLPNHPDAIADRERSRAQRRND